MDRRGHRKNAAGADATPSSHLASSFTDLMASLMVVFILLFVATLSNAAKKRETTTEVLLGALKSALAAGGMDAGGIHKDDRDPYAVVIVMPDDLLFRRGEAMMQERGQIYLDRMVPTLSRIVCSAEMNNKVASVVVEGHTDNVWLGITPPGTDGPQQNLELSQKRSMEVVRGSLVSLADSSERPCFRRLLSASGRGQEELLSEVPADDARQRRVVFKIRTQQDTIDGVARGLSAGAVN